MCKKKNQFNSFSGILFLLVFFFFLQLFSAKPAPVQKEDAASEEVSLTAFLQMDAVQPQPVVKLHPESVQPADLSLFCAADPTVYETSLFSIVSPNEGPDLFCRFFYFHHAAYGEEPHELL
jgi:hypothetical protein